jgi:hypothetical protein
MNKATTTPGFVTVGLQSFVGGESQDSKFGAKYQFGYARHVDFRKKASQFSVLPTTANVSGRVVTDLVQDITQLGNGVKYALGDSGNVYKVTSAGVWSNVGNIGEAGGAGILYRADVDCVYITGQTKVARIKNASTAPVLDINWFATGISSLSTCYKAGGTNTYTLATTVNESTSTIRSFTTDIEPIKKIGVKVITKGTGDWTLTLHDDANNLLGTSTVTNANLTNNAVNYFTFTTPVRALVVPNARTYHFHITSTVADGTLATTTASSMVDCDMGLWANALVTTNNGLHPIYSFAQLTVFGNEKYVAVYQPLQDNPTTADYKRHGLTFPPGYEVNGFAQLELYVAITAEKKASVNDFQEGKMFLWDGISTTYNRFYDIPEGSPESVFSHKNIIHFYAGGSVYQSSGGQPVKIRTFRNTDSEYSGISDITLANPHMMAVRRGILLMGYPTSTTNPNLEHAVYSWGAISRDYPTSYGTSYTLSTGAILNNGSNNIRIGMVRNFGDTLYMSWRDDQNGGYGVDVVNNSSSPSPDFQIQSLYFDNNMPYQEKKAHKILAIFNTLPTGVSIKLKYRINRESTWHYSTDDGTQPLTSGFAVSFSVPKMFIGIEFGMDGVVTGTTTPECTGLFLQFDPRPTRSEVV